MVYGGFICQAIAFGTLFVLYAGNRWRHLWRGRVADLVPAPTLPAFRLSAVIGTMLAVLPLTMQVCWASGSAIGLHSAIADGRDRDFYLAQAANVPFTLAAALGVVMLAFRFGARWRLRVPLAWVGSAEMAAWGGWILFSPLFGAADVASRPTALMSLVYAAQVAAGLLMAVAGAHFLAEGGHLAGAAMTTLTRPRPSSSRIRRARIAALAPVSGVPRWARIAAHAVPFTVLPSSVSRIAMFALHVPIIEGAGLTPTSGVPGLSLPV